MMTSMPARRESAIRPSDGSLLSIVTGRLSGCIRRRNAPLLSASATDGFVRRDCSPFDKHFLDEAQAEWKSEIEPDGMGHDLRPEAMALVAHGRRFHGLKIAPLGLPPVHVTSSSCCIPCRSAQLDGPAGTLSVLPNLDRRQGAGLQSTHDEMGATATTIG